MKNLKMSKKFFLSFGAVILVILVLGGTAFFALSKMHQVISVYSEKTVPNTEYVWQMRRNILSVQRYVLRTIASPDVEDTKKISQLADDESAALLQSLDDYRSNMRTDPALTDAIEKYIKEGADARKKVQDKALLCTPETNEQAYELYVSEYLPKVELMNDAVLKVADEIKKLEIEQNNSAKQVYNISFIGILVAFFGAVALSIGMGATLSRNIVRPLKEIETAAKEMAKGSLTVELTYKAKDELGILSDSMRILTGGVKDIIGDVSYLLGEMGSGNFRVATQIEEKYIGEYNAILLAMRKINGNLSSTLTQINQASDQVSSGSEQVSSGAQALSQGTTEQASSVEELAATINEISSQVKTNAQSAQQGSMLAESAGEKIEEGNRQMQELILAMSEISEKSGRIGRLSRL